MILARMILLLCLRWGPAPSNYLWHRVGGAAGCGWVWGGGVGCDHFHDLGWSAEESVRSQHCAALRGKNVIDERCHINRLVVLWVIARCYR